MLDNLLNVDNVSFASGKKIVFSKVSLSLRRNDIISIIGHNGAGKSVFLKIISEVLKPTSGQIKAQGSISYMPQKVFISKHLPLRVIDFLMLKTDKLDNDLLEQMKITPILESSLHNVSGGQLQKILFCSAIMNNPDILILDEPEQNMDASSRLLLYELIVQYSKNKAIILASHDPNIVFKKSNKVLHFEGNGTVHYEEENSSYNSSVNDKIKELFETYFSCKHN